MFVAVNVLANQNYSLMKSKKAFFLFLFFILQFCVSAQQPCIELYKDMKDHYNITTEYQFRSYFHEMLSLDREQILKTSAISKDDFSLEGAYNAVSGFLSSASYDQSAMDNILRLKYNYEKGIQVGERDYNRFIIDVLDPEVAQKANECLEISYNAGRITQELENDALRASFEYQLALKKLELQIKDYETYKNNGFVISVTGNIETEFLLKIGWYPPNYTKDPVTINSAIISTSLKKIGIDRLTDGVKLFAGDEIQQHFVRIDDNEAFISVSVKSYPSSLEMKFPSRGGRAIPIGTIIASTLPFNQFSKETNNNPTGVFDAKYSKWAPADGRDVSGSYFEKYHVYVPDLRGQFIRGVNTMDLSFNTKYTNGHDTSPRKGVNDYSYQNDEIIEHNHGVDIKGRTSSDGEHSHKVSDVQIGGNGDVVPWGNGANREPKNRTTSKAPDHSHTIRLIGNTKNQGDGLETTVKNVAMYYYIKINN